MPNHLCHYWTGLTVPQTGDSNRRLSTLFNIPRTTLELIMKKVRLCLNEDFVPNNIDSGFRDAIPLLENCNYRIFKPESLDEGASQLTFSQANKSRKVTLCRWVVEVVNG
ncbi:hypothetical protein SFRURICE_001252, partial [Spodoptera frugiperda]